MQAKLLGQQSQIPKEQNYIDTITWNVLMCSALCTSCQYSMTLTRHFQYRFELNKNVTHTHLSSQEHQNEKDDEKNHQERYHHDLPFQAGLLQNHGHSFLHKVEPIGSSFHVEA